MFLLLDIKYQVHPVSETPTAQVSPVILVTAIMRTTPTTATATRTTAATSGATSTPGRVKDSAGSSATVSLGWAKVGKRVCKLGGQTWWARGKQGGLGHIIIPQHP